MALQSGSLVGETQKSFAGFWWDILLIDLFDRLVKLEVLGLPGGAVVKNPPANAGDMGLSPGPVRSHMPRSN